MPNKKIVDTTSENSLDEDNDQNQNQDQTNEQVMNALKQVFQSGQEGNPDNDDDDDEDDEDFEIDEDPQDLGDLMNTYFYDSEKNRNIVDVAIEIRRCFEKQNQILLKLLTAIQK